MGKMFEKICLAGSTPFMLGDTMESVLEAVQCFKDDGVEFEWDEFDGFKTLTVGKVSYFIFENDILVGYSNDGELGRSLMCEEFIIDGKQHKGTLGDLYSLLELETWEYSSDEEAGLDVYLHYKHVEIGGVKYIITMTETFNYEEVFGIVRDDIAIKFGVRYYDSAIMDEEINLTEMMLAA